MNTDRRDFFKTVGTATAAALVTVPPAARAAGDAITPKPTAAFRHALELDGAPAGLLFSVDGGTATADIVEEQPPVNGVVKKHLAGIKYEDIKIACGSGMSVEFYHWIKDSFDRSPSLRKSGAVIAADFNYRELSKRTFFNALITEVGFPALDASSKDAAKMTVKISPEGTSRAPAAGTLQTGQKQKAWLCSNFRLEIDGLAIASAHVHSIEPITIAQSFDTSNGTVQPQPLQVSNLVFTVAEAYAQGLYDWFDDFVIKGNNDDTKEKSGSLEYLSPDLKKVYFTLTFSNLGIFRLTPVNDEESSEAIRRVKVELYIEQIDFFVSTPLPS